MKFWFLEVTNYLELMEGSARDGKPFLAERGPYTYREEKEKINLNWSVLLIDNN